MNELQELTHTAGASYAYAKRYLENEAEMLKLHAIEKVSIGMGRLLYRLSFMAVIVLFVLFLSLAAAFLISVETDSYFIGFGIMAGFYLLCIFGFAIFKKPIRTLFSDEIVMAMEDQEPKG